MRVGICSLRLELLGQGLDAGASSIAWHLAQEGKRAPTLSTIWRALRRAELLTPKPKKRSKAYLTRFEALQPNETWQSDFTHWCLSDGRDIEIINLLDDDSRFLLACCAYKTTT